MSKSNYRRCVALGVTGQHTNTCFPAAIDKLLPGQRIDPEIYLSYEQLMQRYHAIKDRGKNPALKKMYGLIAKEIDADALLFARVHSLEEFKDTVHEALRANLQVSLDIHESRDEAHTVGLEIYDQRRDHYTLTSTHIPHMLRGVLTLDYIFPYMHQPKDPPRVRFPFNDANITFVPAA